MNGLREPADGNGNAEAASAGVGTGNQPLPGAFVLNFADVPESTTPERFNEVIALAADVAMNRLNRRFKRLKGISKDAFEALPMLKKEQVRGESCSICYDEFEDEEEDEQASETSSDGARYLKKRQREDDEVRGPASKRLRENQSHVGSSRGDSRLGSGSDEIITPQEPNDSVPKPDEMGDLYKHSPVKLPCGHVFGRQCISHWTKEHNSCPICRADIVDQTGLNQDVTDDDTEDNVSFDRIRRLLYGRAFEGDATPTIVPASGSANVSNPPTQETQPEGNRRNFFVLRPNQNRENEDPSNTSTNPLDPMNSALARHGFGLIPVTFVNLRPQGDANLNNLRSDATGIQPPPAAQISDTGSPPNSNTATGNNSPGVQDNERLMSILDHLFSITNANRARSSTSSQPGDTSDSNSSAVETGDHLPGLSVSGSNTSNGQESASRPGRAHIFNNFFRFARHLRHSQAARHANPDSEQGNDELFSTGVASVRNPNGVSTVNFHGEMPTPNSLSGEAQSENNSQQSDNGTENQSSTSSHNVTRTN